MTYRYGLVTLCLLLGLAWSALAEEKYPELIGDWVSRQNICTPCIFSIKGVQDDGSLILESTWGNDKVESWGKVTRKGKEINIHITMAAEHQFDLSPYRSGKSLQGTFHRYNQPTDRVLVEFTRAKPKK